MKFKRSTESKWTLHEFGQKGKRTDRTSTFVEPIHWAQLLLGTFPRYGSHTRSQKLTSPAVLRDPFPLILTFHLSALFFSSRVENHLKKERNLRKSFLLLCLTWGLSVVGVRTCVWQRGVGGPSSIWGNVTSLCFFYLLKAVCSFVYFGKIPAMSEWDCSEFIWFYWD